MFERKGDIIVEKNGKDFDDFMMDALEAGCEDVKEMGEYFEAITDVASFNDANDKLKEAGYKIESADISYLANNMISVSEEHVVKLNKLIDTLEDNDDVQEVYTNWDDSSEE